MTWHGRTGRSRLRIAFVSDRDINSREANTHFYMCSALREAGAVIVPVHVQPGRVLGRWRHLLRGGRTASGHAHPYSMAYAQACGPWLQRQLARCELDAVFAPAGSRHVAFLETSTPIVYCSDATATCLDGYYPNFMGDDEALKATARELETRALARAALVSYPSQWAARSAMVDHDADAARICILPWGANLDEVPDRATAIAPRENRECRLLFLNSNWKRKGGDIAIETFQQLRSRDVPCSLTICGSVPDGVPRTRGVNFAGRLHKNDPAQRRRLYELFRTSHLLLFPTQAEAFGHVICEANAFGMPVIARRTGGVSTAIRDGINGYALPADASADAYAAQVQQLLVNRPALASLQRSSRNEFEQRLNWQQWSRSLLDEIRSVIAQQPAVPLQAAAGV